MNTKFSSDIACPDNRYGILNRAVDRSGFASAFLLSIKHFIGSAACVLLIFGLGFTSNAIATFAADCSGCHASIIGGGRVNAAGSVSVIVAAYAAYGMTPPPQVSDATKATIATEIATALGSTTQAVTVNYGSVNNSITINKIVIGGVLDRLVRISGPTSITTTIGLGSLSYDHTAGNCSTQTLVVRGQGGATATTQSSDRTVNITVTPPAGPTASNATFTIPYSTSNTSLDVNPFVSGTTPTGTITLGTLSPNRGTRTATGAMTFNYASSATVYAPTLTLTYSVSGPCSTTSVTRTATINVNPPPAPTVANVGPIVVPATSATMIDLTSSITGVVASDPTVTYALTASQPTAPASGSTSVSGNVVTYTPPGAFTGTTTFTYTKAGPGGASNTATVTLNVTAAPIVSATSVTTAFNTPIAVNLAAFISGTVTSVTPSAPVNGTALATGPTTITFTPTLNFFGTGSFAYTATGPGGTSPTPATVTITVNPPPPTVAARTVTVAYNTATPINLSTSITGVATSVAVTSGPSNGTASASGTTVTYTPTAGYIGPDSFTYTATGPGGTSGPATVSITVNPPGPPVVSDRVVIVPQDVATPIDLTASISGVFSSIAVTSLPANGLTTVNGFVVTYTPATGFTGVDGFAYTATGIGGTSAPATVGIVITARPVVNALSITVPFNTPVSFDLSSLISGGTTFAILSGPSHGSISVNGSVITYTPATGYIGPDALTFNASGPGGTSAPGTVILTVSPPPPTVADRVVNVEHNTPTPIDITALVSGGFTSVAVVTAPTHGTTAVNGNVVTYTPSSGYVGADSFTYTVIGPGGTSALATINIIVGPLKPTAGAATMVVQLNTATTIDLAPFIPGTSITGVSVATAAKHGTIAVNGTKFTYTPTHNYFGPDMFSYIAYGAGGSSAPGIVTVTVVGRPDPSQDRAVGGLIDAQVQTGRRFAKAQVSNYQQRMEALHSSTEAVTTDTDAPTAIGPERERTFSAKTATTSEKSKPGATFKMDANSGSLDFAHASTADRNSLFLVASAQPGESKASDADRIGLLQTTLLSSLVSAATSNSINLASASSSVNGSPMQTGVNFWIGGNLQFGSRDQTSDSNNMRFRTDGVSVGADRRFTDRLVLGLGVGFARDDTDIGADGTNARSKGSSIAAYGSYQPAKNTFIDGLLGFGYLKHQTSRYVSSVDEFARSDRKGDQVFGSIAAGYEYRRDGVLISPYGRLDFAIDRLKQVSETGAGLNALTYLDQSQNTLQGSLGLRAESVHETNFGWVRPRLRVELKHDFEGNRNAMIAYADQLGGTLYSVTAAGLKRNSLLFGVGSDFIFRGGLKLGIDYQVQRSQGPDHLQSLRLMLTKDLDGKGMPNWLSSSKMFEDPVRVDAGYTWDDNLTRARTSSDQLSDHIYSLNVSKGTFFPINANVRVAVNGFLNGEKFHTYTGLGRLSAGAQAELQYRVSSAYDAPTFGAFARIVHDQYESALRTGYRYSVGVNARKSLTDLIDVFGAVATNVRSGKSAVFNTREYSARFNLDYSLGRSGALYLAGEYRRGDSVSSGRPSLENVEIADVFVLDDAYEGGQFFAYRFEARTVLVTLGYNRPLGPRDSIDFSWRRAQSTPLRGPGFSVPGAFRYDNNQYSVVYLTRF